MPVLVNYPGLLLSKIIPRPISPLPYIHANLTQYTCIKYLLHARLRGYKDEHNPCPGTAMTGWERRTLSTYLRSALSLPSVTDIQTALAPLPWVFQLLRKALNIYSQGLLPYPPSFQGWPGLRPKWTSISGERAHCSLLLARADH